MGAHHGFSIYCTEKMSILSPSCFAVCGHHPSPRIATVSPYYRVYQTSPCHIRPLSSYPRTHAVPLVRFTFSHFVSSTLLLCRNFYPNALPQGHVYASSSSSRLLVFLFVLSDRSKSPTRTRSFSVFAWSTGPPKCVFIHIAS